jgi:hypothetical protein
VLFRPSAPRVPPASAPAYEIPGTTNPLKIEVLNGTGRVGLARAATRQLRQQGFDVVFYGETPAPVKVSQVIGRRGNPQAGRPVAEALNIDSVRVLLDPARRVDVSVWLGQDFHPRADIHP